MGELKFLELRKRAENEIGIDNFDIRVFHDNCLKHGALPMSNLEQVINDYILESKKNI